MYYKHNLSHLQNDITNSFFVIVNKSSNIWLYLCVMSKAALFSVNFGNKHPDPVVETSSLSSVESPEVTYRLMIPEAVVDYGYLSALQLETIVYACQKHETFLPSGERVGFLVGTLRRRTGLINLRNYRVTTEITSVPWGCFTLYLWINIKSIFSYYVWTNSFVQEFCFYGY